MSNLRSLLNDVKSQANFNPHSDAALLSLKKFTESVSILLEELVNSVETLENQKK